MRWIKLLIISIMTLSLSMSAFGYNQSDKSIIDVDITITSNADIGMAYSETAIQVDVPENVKYGVDHVLILNEGSQWDAQDPPLIRIYLKADTGNYFRIIKASQIKLHNGMYVKAAREDNGYTLMVDVRLTLISNCSLENPAGGSKWVQDSIGWWYDNGNGTYKHDEWFTDTDGKSYYFGSDGYMLHDTLTPDGYQVGSDGAWIPLAATSGAGTASSQGTESTVLTIPASDVSGTHYYLNRSTGKFHYEWCSSVKDINAENLGEYIGDRSAAISKGYKPCGRCNP